MSSPLAFQQNPYLNVNHLSACLVKKDLVRAMIQFPDAASTSCNSPDPKPSTLLCFENLEQNTYGSEQRFLHGNVTTLWLIQNLSHRASSN